MFYDGLSRLLTADYSVGSDYVFGYDVAGNLTNNNGVTRTYNAANQMTNDGTNALTYDNNGNLTNDGVNAYTWDRANRMLTAPGSTSYKYDGVGNRIQQTVSGMVTAYLNDVQPGLTQLLAETASGNTTRYVQGVRGIHATESHAGVWSYFAQDGLGSVRGVFDNVAAVVSSQSFNPMGVPATDYGKGFGFTGEYTDANDLLYLRARYYAPSKGAFTALDPFEGLHDRPMSMNGYSWVEGNVPNAVDPSGQYTNVMSVLENINCIGIPIEPALPNEVVCGKTTFSGAAGFNRGKWTLLIYLTIESLIGPMILISYRLSWLNLSTMARGQIPIRKWFAGNRYNEDWEVDTGEGSVQVIINGTVRYVTRVCTEDDPGFIEYVGPLPIG